MIEWYSNKDLIIEFDCVPSVSMRCITPDMDEDEKEEIKNFPFLNNEDLNVCLTDLKKNKEYYFKIARGFYWDGATIPRVFWRLIGSKTDPSFLIPSMIHDKLCNYHNLVDNDRNFSSRVFKGLLLASGVNKITAQTMYLAVDNFQRFCGW